MFSTIKYTYLKYVYIYMQSGNNSNTYSKAYFVDKM